MDRAPSRPTLTVGHFAKAVYSRPDSPTVRESGREYPDLVIRPLENQAGSIPTWLFDR